MPTPERTCAGGCGDEFDPADMVEISGTGEPEGLVCRECAESIEENRAAEGRDVAF